MEQWPVGQISEKESKVRLVQSFHFTDGSTKLIKNLVII